jgi:signal transduction histidine kinase
MRRSSAGPRILLIMAILLATASVAVGTFQRARAQESLDHRLTEELNREVATLNNYFERARSVALINAQNPAFRRFYELPGSRIAKVKAGGEELDETIRALDYLETLYPDSIGEACFIDAGGAESSRVVRGEVAPFEELSLDESKNPFFHPSFALEAGQVFQAKPYVSPDTNEWVIANATPVPFPDGRNRAIVHFEVTVESFRQEAALAASDLDVYVVEARTGRVVIDSSHPQRMGAPLGDPNNHSFRSVVASGRRGLTRIDGKPVILGGLTEGQSNANEWVVVVAGAPLGLIGSLGMPTVTMLAIALIVLAVAIWNLWRSGRDHRRIAKRVAMAAEQERIRLASELHDGPVQHLTAVMYDMEMGRFLLNKGDIDEAKPTLDSCSTGLSKEIQELRRLMTLLRPPALQERGLPAALSDLVAEFQGRCVAELSLDAPPALDLPEEVEAILYRIAQEALTNCVKHAEASHIRVVLGGEQSGVRLRVEDDGMGFHPREASSDDHFGLLIMQERAEAIGGELSVTSTPGAGTAIEVSVSPEFVRV